MTPREAYARDVHYELLGSLEPIVVGMKRNGQPRTAIAILVLHFTDERDARSAARRSNCRVFRVDRQRRTELQIRRTR